MIAFILFCIIPPFMIYTFHFDWNVFKSIQKVFEYICKVFVFLFEYILKKVFLFVFCIHEIAKYLYLYSNTFESIRPQVWKWWGTIHNPYAKSLSSAENISTCLKHSLIWDGVFLLKYRNDSSFKSYGKPNIIIFVTRLWGKNEVGLNLFWPVCLLTVETQGSLWICVGYLELSICAYRFLWFHTCMIVWTSNGHICQSTS